MNFLSKYDDGTLIKKLKKIKFSDSGIDYNDIVDNYIVYIKPGCYYSNSAINLLKNKKISNKVVDFFNISVKEQKNVLEKTKKYNNNKEYRKLK